MYITIGCFNNQVYTYRVLYNYSGLTCHFSVHFCQPLSSDHHPTRVSGLILSASRLRLRHQTPEIHLPSVLEVVVAEPEFGVPLPKLLVPLPDGQQAALLQPSGSRPGRGEGVLGLCARHESRQLLEIRDQELAEEVRAREELGGNLKCRQTYFSVFLGQV